jgi:hypothetical protein
MKTKNIGNPNLRDLCFQPIELGIYKILGIHVRDLDANFRKTAYASVIAKNPKGLWDKQSIHLIELKHCYNRLSKGPNKTQYEDLPGLFLEIAHISPALKIADFDIVTWGLYRIDPDQQY